jgi:DNA-directed RNA polymerase specialized sigma24 family protein
MTAIGLADLPGNPPGLRGHEQAMQVDDSVLWSRAQNGDRDAFGMLFERHGPTIYNYCFRRVGNWATAEDLLSIVFLEAWRRLDKSLPSGKELPWLLGIATNVVRNGRRSERRYAAALRRVPEPRSRLAYQLREEEGLPDAKVIWFEPYFPDGQITCSACG